MTADLGLQPGTKPDQLEPIADYLPGLPDLRRRYPRLRQPAEPEQVDEVVGIPLVVLHPAMPPIVPQRVSQMDPGAHLLEHIRRPVPSERRFQHDLRLRPG